MEIGLFQLENLFLNPNMFVFMDLRQNPSTVHPSIDRLMKNATAVSTEKVSEFLAERKVPHERPIVLACADGAESRRIARDLETAGFEQIYIVAGGVNGLLLEV